MLLRKVIFTTLPNEGELQSELSQGGRKISEYFKSNAAQVDSNNRKTEHTIVHYDSHDANGKNSNAYPEPMYSRQVSAIFRDS